MIIVNFMFQWNYTLWWFSDSIAKGNFAENSKIVNLDLKISPCVECRIVFVG